MKSRNSGIKFVLLVLSGLVFMTSLVGTLASMFFSTKALITTCVISFVVMVVVILVILFSQPKYVDSKDIYED